MPRFVMKKAHIFCLMQDLRPNGIKLLCNGKYTQDMNRTGMTIQDILITVAENTGEYTSCQELAIHIHQQG